MYPARRRDSLIHHTPGSASNRSVMPGRRHYPVCVDVPGPALGRMSQFYLYGVSYR